VWRRKLLEFLPDHPVVMRHRDLVRDVVLLKAKMVRRRCEDMDGLARRKASELRHVVLDNESAAWLQVSRGVAKRLHLLILRGQIGDGIPQEIDEPKESVDLRRRKVADGHIDVRGLALCTQLGNHGRRQFDPGHLNATLAEGDGDAAGSNAELKSGTCPGQIGEESNGWLDYRGLEQLRPERLVSLSNPLIKVGLRHRKEHE